MFGGPGGSPSTEAHLLSGYRHGYQKYMTLSELISAGAGVGTQLLQKLRWMRSYMPSHE